MKTTSVKELSGAAYSPDGRYLVTLAADDDEDALRFQQRGLIQIWHLKNGIEAHNVVLTESKPLDVVFTNRNECAVVCTNGELLSWTAPLSPPNSTEGVPLLGVGKTSSPPDSAIPNSKQCWGYLWRSLLAVVNTPEACGSLVHNREQWHTIAGASTMKVALSNEGTRKNNLSKCRVMT